MNHCGLTSAVVEYGTHYGTAAISWEIKDGHTIVDGTVPPNTSAEIDLPGQGKQTVGSGKHTFTAVI